MRLDEYTKIRRDANRRSIAEIKAETGCASCGYNKCAAALSYHHRDPSEKLFPVANIGGRSAEQIMREMEKCDLLCANCHHEIEDEIRKSAEKIIARRLGDTQLDLFDSEVD